MARKSTMTDTFAILRASLQQVTARRLTTGMEFLRAARSLAHDSLGRRPDAAIVSSVLVFTTYRLQHLMLCRVVHGRASMEWMLALAVPSLQPSSNS